MNGEQGANNERDAMKQFAIIAALLLAAGLCLAQSDSTKAANDSVTVRIEVQNAGSQDASLTVTTEPGTTDSTVTVSINSGQKQGKRPRWRRNWAVGVRASSLSSLPGSIFLQKIIGRNIFISCGFEYSRNPYGVSIPRVDYTNYNNTYKNGEYRNSYSSWYLGISPEFLMPVVSHRRCRVLTGLSGDFKYSKARGSSYQSQYSQNDTTYFSVTGQGKSNVYSLFIPLVIERSFHVRNHLFFIGLQNSIVSLDYSKQSSEWEDIDCPYSGPIQTIHTGYSYTQPVRVTIKNPFQNTVSLMLKWYL